MISILSCNIKGKRGNDMEKIAIIIISYLPLIYTIIMLLKESKKSQKNFLLAINPEADKLKIYIKNYLSKPIVEQKIIYALIKRNINFYKWLAVVVPIAWVSNTISELWNYYISSDWFFLLLIVVFIGSSLISLMIYKIYMDTAIYYILKEYWESTEDEQKKYFSDI